MKAHELADLFPMMSDDEIEQLASDIKQNGQKEKIVLLDGKILDGRNRYAACKIAKVEPATKDYTGKDPLGYVISLNLHRRHLTESQRAIVAAKMANIQKHHHKNDRQICLSQNEAAEKLNVSERIVRDAKKILIEKPQEAKAIERGEKTINEVVREIKYEEQKERHKELDKKSNARVDGKYDVIVIDPPWPMEKIDRECSPTQTGFDYPTMQLHEIGQIKLPAANDCHLFVWTTQKFLPTTYAIITGWGFKYVFTMVWHKNGGFQPFNLPQYNCEFVLYARKGTPEFTTTKGFFTCFNADRGKHSEKPQEFYTLVERVTYGKRLDMFNRREIKGFDRWGNEA